MAERTPFEVIVLGVGDSFSELHHTASLLLCCDGFYLAIDCPDRYREALRAAAQRSGRELPLHAIDHVLITHAHCDHMNGLEGVAFYKHFVEQKRVQLHTPPELRESLWSERLRVSMGTLYTGSGFKQMQFADYFAHHALSWQQPVQIGPFSLRARRTLHHVPTAALLIEAHGRTLGYSADTAYDPTLLEFLKDADCIIHETNFGPAHTPYEALAALPQELRDKMRLIHYHDHFDLAASVIRPLREGEIVRVGCP